MATLWADHKPQPFLTTCGASAFKIIQTSKDPLKDPKSQKSKSNKKFRDKGGNKDNTVVLAEILSLL
ncbi:hypothetical protein RhiirA5_435467 [Rhizophagus irregularis]|uniref:Uncharacterized protein n=1 Tax=Rhizophagus irregularis TaxID=588596 RepID=A0A2N0NNC4_9GLOM|nr:hypothetical protein RhiirA5_435467 [Rhizophagus irregularis]